MSKLYDIEFIKDTEKFKKGETAKASKKSAEAAINAGYAIYYQEPELAIEKVEIIQKFIPKQLRDPEYRFILLRKKDKKPVEKDWQETNNYSFTDDKLINHLAKGGNYGIIGGFGNLILVDSDSEEVYEVCKRLPRTFTVKSVSPQEYKKHYYFICKNKIKPIRLSKEKQGDLGDVRSVGQYVVAPNCYVVDKKKGIDGTSKIIDDIGITEVTEEFIRSIFKEYIDPADSTELTDKSQYEIDTKKRLSEFTKNCNVPDYVLNNKLKGDTSKNWKLFPYVIDILNARDVSTELYKRLAEVQKHNDSAVKGWVKNAKEGTLAKTSCKKMRDYLDRYHPELKETICGDCKLYKKVREEEEKKREEELKQKLLEEHRQKISQDKDVTGLLKNPDLFNLITEQEFDKRIVREFKTRKTIFLVTCMRLVENLNKATDNLTINAFSGTGKDHISEAVFGIIPPEEKEELIRISPKVLAYTRNRIFEPKATWKKCSLRLEDIGNDVLTDNSFKVMESANPNGINKSKIVWRGKIIEFEIEGKPSIIKTIANPNPKEEQLRRSPLCYLDEGIDQTKEILKRQAEYAKKGLSTEYDEKIINALRLLNRVPIKVPFADKLVGLFNPQEIVVRTHFNRFLDYIKASCALHQYQREKDKEGFYLATGADYDIARIALIKTTSNILMIPLTKLQKDIMGVFEKKNLERQSIDDLSNIKEIQRLNITDLWLRIQVDFLASKRFLNKDREKREDEAGKTIPKPVFIYSYNEMQKLEIPYWKDLEKSLITINNKNTIISKNTINTGVNIVNKVNIRELPKATNKLDFSKSGIKEISEDG